MQEKNTSNITDVIQDLTQNEDILIQELYEHGSHKANKRTSTVAYIAKVVMHYQYIKVKQDLIITNASVVERLGML